MAFLARENKIKRKEENKQMKKYLIAILAMLLTVAVFSANSGQGTTRIGSVNAAAPKIQLAVGPFTVVGLQMLYNSMTFTPATSYTYFLEDAANTYTATAAKVTLTALPLGMVDAANYLTLGTSGLSSNGASVGVWYGVTFTSGVVLDGGISSAASGSITITTAVIGK